MFPNRLLLINSELRLLHANEASAGGWAHQGRVCSSSPRAPPGPRSAHASRDRRASDTGTGMTRGWQMPGFLHAPTGAPLPVVTACLAPGDRGTAVLGAVSLRHSGGWHSRASLRQQIPRSHHSYFLLCSKRSPASAAPEAGTLRLRCRGGDQGPSARPAASPAAGHAPKSSAPTWDHSTLLHPGEKPLKGTSPMGAH